MFMMITFPWPVPSANAALAGLPSTSNRVRIADLRVDDLQPLGVGPGIHRLEDARND